MSKHHSHSAMTIVLRALLPYTRENLLLSFSPNRFFNELEQSSSFTRKNIITTFYRAKRHGYIINSGSVFSLTEDGLKIIKPFVPSKLKSGGQLMIIFDIPQKRRPDRDKLRRLLKTWKFKQIQKSVWATNKDYKEVIIKTLKEFKLEEYVELHETARLYPG